MKTHYRNLMTQQATLAKSLSGNYKLYNLHLKKYTREASGAFSLAFAGVINTQEIISKIQSLIENNNFANAENPRNITTALKGNKEFKKIIKGMFEDLKNAREEIYASAYKAYVLGACGTVEIENSLTTDADVSIRITKKDLLQTRKINTIDNLYLYETLINRLRLETNKFASVVAGAIVNGDPMTQKIKSFVDGAQGIKSKFAVVYADHFFGAFRLGIPKTARVKK